MTMEQMAQRLEELEKRVTDAEDLEEVRQLQYKFVNCVAFMNWDELLSYFADDATMDVGLDHVPPLVGIEAIRERFMNTISKGHTGEDGPYVVHPIVSKQGDIIKGNFMLYVQVRYVRTGQAMFWLQNIYNNEYKKVDGVWKISKLSLFGRLGIAGIEPPFPGC